LAAHVASIDAKVSHGGDGMERAWPKSRMSPRSTPRCPTAVITADPITAVITAAVDIEVIPLEVLRRGR
jgi:hypothetical protein